MPLNITEKYQGLDLANPNIIPETAQSKSIHTSSPPKQKRNFKHLSNTTPLGEI
jgi:hypothetical protein